MIKDGTESTEYYVCTCTFVTACAVQLDASMLNTCLLITITTHQHLRFSLSRVSSTLINLYFFQIVKERTAHGFLL
jgi:hypothetical protein